ncbi:hypothetical protein [Marinibactrum halimedae]|uniref:Cytochrome c family protein n=1 Tax=Marinibactrum halimedae TaxID=1444977 RepID=A0AA37TB04_9GAMM|nr:hypothetical protein [Marinibactrum halimedae]MCD9460964.1 hypothetical protein [Marinibactrum halimedae]GLS28093.1 hypothetical protein GCM10007877_38120 [Marinibactrum halimedae]
MKTTFWVLLFFFCVAHTASAASSKTSKADIIRYVVTSPVIEPDVDCRNTGAKDAVELFSWQMFSRLNSPIYYNESSYGGKIDPPQAFWGELPSWEMKAPNVAPYWSLWFNQSDIQHIAPPFIRLDKHWQSDNAHLIQFPPVDEEPKDKFHGQVPLVDNFGNTVRYEILLNRPWFYSSALFLEGSTIESDTGNFFNLGKCGTYASTSIETGSLINLPTIMVKLAWRKLTKEEDQSRYITMADGKEVWGLAAWHMAAKTTKAWPWIWSTYEHRNNFEGYTYNGEKVRASFLETDEQCQSSPCGTPLEPNTDQSGNVKRFNSIVKSAFLKDGSPLTHYKMLGVQHASFDTIPEDQIPTYKEDLAACETMLSKEGPHPPFYISDSHRYIYSYNVAKTQCNIAQEITTPTLFNPLFEPFPAVPPKKNFSCISCHVDANIINKPGMINTFSDFSFTPTHYGVPSQKRKEK